MPSRRDALVTLAAASAVPALQAQHQHAETPATAARPAGPRKFAAGEFAVLTRVVDLIIPRSDTPGAVDAGVPFFIDADAQRNASLARAISEGIVSLNKEAGGEGGFTALPEQQQVALLTRIREDLNSPLGRFFTLIKNATIDGYYSTREGLQQELGWNGNTFLREFVGCTHPEHQAAPASLKKGV